VFVKLQSGGVQTLLSLQSPVRCSPIKNCDHLDLYKQIFAKLIVTKKMDI
jgi:hypothetical protein